MSCTHNRMVERKGDPEYAWQCADCGYVYGKDDLTDLRVQNAKLLAALEAAKAHLEYSGYGDKWEREYARETKLAEQIEAALHDAKIGK